MFTVKDGIPCRMALIAVKDSFQVFPGDQTGVRTGVSEVCMRCAGGVPATGLLCYGSQFCIDPAHYFCVIDQLFL